jgi:hypothetical protein
MTLEVRIERLVLDGVTMTRAEREALPAAVERELRGLIAPGEAPRRPPRSTIARDIATAIHGSLPSLPHGGGGPR